MPVKVGEEIQQSDCVTCRLPFSVQELVTFIAYILVSTACDSLSALIDLAFYTHVQLL